MRLPTLSRDYWTLASGEARHDASPDTFEIPTLAERSSLVQGQAAKLIFEIEAEEEDGTVSTSAERMWVIVVGQFDGGYIGLLDNEPATIPTDSDFYLCPGAEVPFRPEHIIAIGRPPAEYSAKRLATGPVHRWPRNEA